MELKFYLNKFLKVDNIEGYTLATLDELRKAYDKFLDKSGFDPDFPMLSLGNDGGDGKKGETIKVGKGNNVYNLQKEGETIEETKSRLSLGYSDSSEEDGGFTLHK